MTDQIPLEFGFTPSYAADDFLVSACNADAFSWIQRWPDWPSPHLALCGPTGCGKTHLAHVWQGRAGAAMFDVAALARSSAVELSAAAAALVIDGLGAEPLDASSERMLFHLHNLIAERRGHLLLCGGTPPARWPVALPDLRSRLAAMPVAAVAPPDDALLEALLAKLFGDRQLTVDRGTIIYMVARMERSFDAARRLVDAVDRRALATQRRPGIGLVRELLGDVDTQM